MQWANLVVKAVLFIALIPGVLVRFPKDGSFQDQLLVHSIIFALLNYVIYMQYTRFQEWFMNPDSRVLPPCPPGSDRTHTGDCRMKGEGEAP